MNWIKLIVRLVIGAFFFVSTYGKVQSLEAFEIYVFRSTFLSFDVASILSRLVIGAELVAGIGFITKFSYQTIWRLTTIFILTLTAFLAWQVTAGGEDNCFCLGELMEMSPLESLLKNVVLILLLLLVRSEEDTMNLKFKKLATGVLFVGALSVPFILSPPDIFVKGRFIKAEHNQQALDEAIRKGDIPERFVKGKKLVSFYSMKCKYCRMSSTRISAMVEKNDIDRAKANIVFGGLQGNPIEFFEETHSQVFEFTRLHRDPFLKITKGMMPLTLLVENGRVVEEMNYRTIDESRVIEFLNGN